MRALRFLLLVLLALTASGCVYDAPPRIAAAPVSDLDAMAYGAPPHVIYASSRRDAAATPTGTEAESAYTLDSGDKLRIVVFGQEGLSNSYTVDAAGRITMPLIGAVPARGLTPAALSRNIAARLKQGFIREPHVAAEIEVYRPFFILGEVTAPGQYSYVANMTVETAVAIAGGFTPRASRGTVDLSRHQDGQTVRGAVPLTYPIRPGDTIVVNERWF